MEPITDLVIKLKLLPANPGIDLFPAGALFPTTWPFGLPFNGSIGRPFVSAAIAGLWGCIEAMLESMRGNCRFKLSGHVPGSEDFFEEVNSSVLTGCERGKAMIKRTTEVQDVEKESKIAVEKDGEDRVRLKTILLRYHDDASDCRVRLRYVHRS